MLAGLSSVRRHRDRFLHVGKIAIVSPLEFHQHIRGRCDISVVVVDIIKEFNCRVCQLSLNLSKAAQMIKLPFSMCPIELVGVRNAVTVVKVTRYHRLDQNVIITQNCSISCNFVVVCFLGPVS